MLLGSAPLGALPLGDAPVEKPPPTPIAPNPLTRPFPTVNLTHLDSLKIQLLRPFAQFDWPNPLRRAQQQPDMIVPNIGIFPVVSVQAPFASLDWPVPRGAVPAIANRSHLDPLKLELLGQDQFFGAPGQVPPNTDWPVPRGPAPGPIGNRTHVDPLRLNLIGQDRIYGAPGQAPTYEMPVPRGYPPGPVGNRSHLDPVKLNLLGQDQFFGAPGQAPTFDWPNPARRGPPQPVAPPPNLVISFTLTPAPFASLDWPVPKGMLPALTPPAQNLTILIAPAAAAAPFSGITFANPARASSTAALSAVGGTETPTPAVVTGNLTTQFIVNMGRMMNRR